MSIQSTINQGLSLASLLVSQTPLAAKGRAKSTAEVAEQKAKEEAADKEVRFQKLAEHAESGIPADKTAAGQDAEIEVYGDVAALAKERYLANPTEETYSDYMDYSTGYREAKESLSTKRAEAEKNAMEAGKEEARRLAISRSITEGIYGAEPDPRGTPEERASHLASIKKTGGIK